MLELQSVVSESRAGQMAFGAMGQCLYLIIYMQIPFLFSSPSYNDDYLNRLFLAGFPVILSVLKEERDDFEMVQLLCCQFKTKIC